jgi:hypothetical protein
MSAMLFTASAHGGLARGEITRTFRTWTRPQVKVGGRYHAGPVDLIVDDLKKVPVRKLTDSDAQKSGFDDRHALVEFLRAREALDDKAVVWRVDFHAVERADEPSIADDRERTDADVEDIERRLERLDASSPTGPWTGTVLRLIAENPGVVSTDLAEKMGRERAAFKTDVRKLKRLGLTISLDVGYRLSPRGEAFLGR